MARRRRGAVSNEEVLAQARALFVERGYAVPTQQIAAAVGLTWGAIALRFASKRALFDAAMAAPALEPGDAACEQAGLPELLQRLRAHLVERWPRQLQRRLAAPAASAADDAQGLLPRLAAAFEAQARRGAIRSDMSPSALARVVLALVTGDVALRFVARQPAGAADPAFIDDLLRLLAHGVNAVGERGPDHAG